MCEYKQGEPWYSYAWRQICEKTQIVLAVSGFAVLAWYSHKADTFQAGILSRASENQKNLIHLIKEAHQYQAAQTQAMQELTNEIKRIHKL